MKTAKLGIYMMLLLLVIGLVQAAADANFTCAVNTPAISGTIGVKDYNVTIAVTPTGTVTANATWCYYTIQDTLNGTVAQTIKNSSLSARGDQANFTGQNLSGTLYDSRTYIFGGLCRNGTGTEEATCTTSTGVLSDFTNPVPTITTPVDGSTNKQKFVVDGTCNNCSSATLWLDSNSYLLALTGSGGAEAFSYTFANGAPPEKGYNNVYVTAEDLNSDSVSSTPIKWIVSENSMAAKTAYAMNTLANQEQQQQQYNVAVKQSNTTTWIVIAIVVSVALYFAFGRKK